MFFRSVVLVSGSQVFAKGSAFILLAILARQISVDDYGLLTLILSFSSILLVLADFGVDTLVIKDIVQKPHDIAEVINKSFVARLLLTVFFSIIVLVISLSYVANTAHATFIVVVILGTALSSFSKFLRQPFYAIGKAEVDAFAFAVEKFLFLLAGIAFVFSDFGVYSYSTSLLLSASLSIVICINLSKRYTNNLVLSKLNKCTFDFLIEAMPIGLNAMFVVLYFRSGQFFIEYYKGSYELGLYGVVSVFVFGLMTVTSSIVQVLFPRIVKVVGNKKDNSELSFSIILVALLIFTPVISFVSFNSVFFIELIFGEKYSEVAAILSIVIFQILFFVVTPIYGSILRATDKSYEMLKATGIGLVVNIVMCALLIEEYGMLGVATAVLVTELVVCLISGWAVSSLPSVFGLVLVTVFAYLGAIASYQYINTGELMLGGYLLLLWLLLLAFVMVSRKKIFRIINKLIIA